MMLGVQCNTRSAAHGTDSGCRVGLAVLLNGDKCPGLAAVAAYETEDQSPPYSSTTRERSALTGDDPRRSEQRTLHCRRMR